MTVQPRPAQHRSDQRARTPLTDLAASASANASVIGRRTALFTAGSGLLVSLMGAAPATAAPVHTPTSTVDLDALTSQARATLETAPAVTTAADASWTVELTSITVTPKPEPIPEPVVVEAEPEPEPVRSTRSTSRTSDRPAVAAAPAEQAAPAAQAAPAPEAAPAAAPASANGSAVIDAASQLVGIPYASGGTTTAGFDCSGFTSYVFAQVGISLPRTSGAQAAAGTVVSRADAQPGDLIYSPGHIAIYAGGNTQIDSPRPGKTIQFREIWQSNPTFIRIG